MAMKARVGWSVMVLGTGLIQLSCETPSAPTSAASAGSRAEAPRPVAEPVKKEAPVKKKVEVAAKPTPPKPESKPVEVPAPAAEKPKGRISQMDIGTLFQLQGEGRAFLVDVRPAFFYNLDHIPGAISLPLKTYDAMFPGRKAQLDAAVGAGKVIVLYCADENCPDGRSTARKLAKEGYSTSVYTAGWKEWKASGL